MTRSVDTTVPANHQQATDQSTDKASQKVSDVVTQQPGGSQMPAFLALCADQVRSAVSDAMADIQALERTLYRCIDDTEAIARAVGSKQFDKLDAAVDRMSEQRQEAMMSVQFADRLAQRLDHCQHNLEELAKIATLATIEIPEGQWHALLDDVQQNLTMAEERQVFNRHYPRTGANESSQRDDDGPDPDLILF